MKFEILPKGGRSDSVDIPPAPVQKAENQEPSEILAIFREFSKKWIQFGFPLWLAFNLYRESSPGGMVDQVSQYLKGQYFEVAGDTGHYKEIRIRLDTATKDLAETEGATAEYEDLEDFLYLSDLLVSSEETFPNTSVGMPKDLENMTGQEMLRLIDHGIPEHMMTSVKRIHYEDRYLKMPEGYGIPGNQAAHANFKAADITLTKDMEYSSASQFIDIVSHEVAHLNGWHSPSLSREDKIVLIKKILARVQSPDRFHSDYVEEINNSNKKTEMTLKCGEYFAEIVAAYLSPAKRHLMPQKDRDLVAEQIRKIDPNFDIKKSDQARKTIIMNHYHRPSDNSHLELKDFDLKPKK